MDPLMSSVDCTNVNCTNRHRVLIEIVNQFYSDDSRELPDLYEKYDGDLFNESDNYSDPTAMGEEKSEFQIELDYINDIITKNTADQSKQAIERSLNVEQQQQQQQPIDNKSKSTITTAIKTSSNNHDYNLPTSTVYLTTMPCSNISSPEPSRKRADGCFAKETTKTEKEFQANQSIIKQQQQQQQQPIDNKSKSTPNEIYNYNPPTPSVYLTPMPTPSPYSNASSPESSRKRAGGRPAKDILKAEKEFQKKQKKMNKIERKIASNNISSLKHRRMKSQKLKDLEEEEIKLIQRNEQLNKRYQKLQSDIATIIEILKNFLKTPEVHVAFESMLINFNTL